MRLGFWPLFSALTALPVVIYLVNPLDVPSLDPRLRLLGIAPFLIPANSMSPTLENGDHIIVNAWPYRLDAPQRGDLVVFFHPQQPETKYVKRLVGLPGERVALRGGTVFIDSEALDEPYVLDLAQERTPETTEMAERTIPAGEFFMLGDNRNHSYDSRYWGPVPAANLIGRAGKLL